MKVQRLCGLLILIFMLVGCGSNAKILRPINNADFSDNSPQAYSLGKIDISTDEVPEHFVAAVKGYLKSELKKCNLLCQTDSELTRIIDIDITYYRMRSGFSRMMFGMLAGKDGIKSTIKILDNKNDSIVGESEISTFNIMAVGGEDDVARMHAEAIVKFISGNSDA